MRHRQPELMDDPDIDEASHTHALRGLARINRLSRAHVLVSRALPRQTGPLHVLDIATGSADIPIALARQARRDRRDLRITACDISDQALRIAQQHADAAGVQIRTHTLDAINDTIPEADAVICSLFCHHLDDDACENVLRKMATAARRAVIINDLRRCVFGTTLARIIPRLVTRSNVVHIDAVRSAHAAYSIQELSRIADRAGLRNHRIRSAFPARMCLQWERPA